MRRGISVYAYRFRASLGQLVKRGRAHGAESHHHDIASFFEHGMSLFGSKGTGSAWREGQLQALIAHGNPADQLPACSAGFALAPSRLAFGGTRDGKVDRRIT